MAESYIKQLNTPFFLLDESILLGEIETLNTTLQHYWNNYRIGYSVKTNSLPALAKLLKANGLCAEVVSEDEYNTISALGYTPREIICNGPVKGRNWVEHILENNVLLNIDSHREVEYVIQYSRVHPEKTFSIGIRVNLDIEKVFPGESKGGECGSRFGFSKETGELTEVIERLKRCPNLEIGGFHFHMSTINRQCGVYRWIVREFADIMAKHTLTEVYYLDIGGGFYGGLIGKPTWNEYIRNISDELKEYGFSPQKLTLLLEPGVSLLASSFSYYTRIVDSKTTSRYNFAICDGSRIHIDPLMHKSSYYYQIIRETEALGNISAVQQLAGFTCLEYDYFFKLLNEPLLCENDMIRFDKVGAYTLSLSPLFISYFPAVYIQKCDGSLECIRGKWGTSEFLQLEKNK